MAVEVKRSNYRDKLVRQIREAGQELIDRAEQMVDENTNFITGFSIHIDFPQGDYVRIPEISWTTDVLCKNSRNSYINKFNK